MLITLKFSTFLRAFLFVILLAAVNGRKCRETERMALLQFKAEMIDEHGRLSSWGGFTNCCEWKGVVCDNRTNHVIALDLHGPKHVSVLDPYFATEPSPAAPLRGKISTSLLHLPHLQYLDLSLNHFNGTTIPNFIGSFSKLQHLDLSFANFGGSIPHHIGNLSLLRLLDLAGNSLVDTDLDWLSGVPSLEHLDLSSARLERCTTWLQALHKLTSLKQLHLSNCHLPSVEPISITPINSSSSLVVLDLSSNYYLSSSVLLRFLNMTSSFAYIDFSYIDIEGRILDALGKLISLSHLGLSSSNLNNSIADVLGNLTSLSYLDLSYNELQGEFPRPSKNLSSLTYLDLSENNLNGQLSRLLTWLWDSTSLKHLILSENVLSGSFPNMSRFSVLNELQIEGNLFNGPILESNFRLPNLEYLDLSVNKFTGSLPNFSTCPWLIVLLLADNNFNGSFTENIRNLSKIEYLFVGYNELEGVITEAHLSSLPQLTTLDLSFNLNITIVISPFWNHHVQIRVLNLAYCKLGSYFPKWLKKQNQLQLLDISNSGIFDMIPDWFWGKIQMCTYLNMSHNRIHGVLPDLSSAFVELMAIDLSSNEFTGPLPHLPPLVYNIDLSRNKFSGPISKFCSFKDLDLLLDLSNNQLSGDIPQDCFMNLLSLGYLNLANNNLSGEIPTTNNLACRVFSLHLRNNRFRGEIPRSLMNCSKLQILDVGENEFMGKIPGWLGGSMPDLGVLILRSNMFSGSLPSSICLLTNLQVLDISFNKITGSIPNCVNNFTLLSSEADPDSWSGMFFSTRNGAYDDRFYDSASVIWKGVEETYITTLGLLKMIDLSSNELTGEIPCQLTSLIGLVGLNLSRNNLVDLIPGDIDKLKLLNFLDLSRNKLSGGIPPALSKLSHLGVLDLSFNNLSGRIPWDAHMQTFGDSTYLGNPRLCGPPLLGRPCPEDEKPSDESDDEEDNFSITRGFYISMVLGFFVAFWVAFWILFFNKWWDASTRKIFIIVSDWLYVQILVNKRRLLRYFSST
ncbi:hypothetical protein C2S51_021674 [Perilla frutescens var. frutescens]|nr:hypothetical protein C2S51_021674 [Perilla frutescens var. frutescens]